VTAPGIPNDYALSTSCFGLRLPTVEDQIVAAAAMGFRKLELGLGSATLGMDGLDEARRETGMQVSSMLVGCRDAQQADSVATRLSSPSSEERERAMNSVRRHVRMAQAWRCPIVLVRAGKVEDKKLARGAEDLTARAAREGTTPELRAEIADFVPKLQRAGQRQVEHLCRCLHALTLEMPDTRFALQPGVELDDLLGFEAMSWVLDDLAKRGLQYWHDVGRIQQRSRFGLQGQVEWLAAHAPRTIGVHLQDANESESDLPIGQGQVDFKAVAELLPRNALRVLEIGQRHGRAELLASVQTLIDLGI